MAGMRFDSQRERDHYNELLLFEKAGEISKLRKDHSFPLVVNGLQISSYKIDFTFMQRGKLVGHEAKGYFHEVDRLRFKLFLALHSDKFGAIRLQDRYSGIFYPVRLSPSDNRKIEYYSRLGWKLWRFKDKRRATTYRARGR